MRRHRRRRHGSDLTPLIDVLFIMLFASLLHARSAVDKSRPERQDPAQAVDAGPLDAGVTDTTVIDAAVIDAAVPDASLDEYGPGSYLARSRRIAAEIAGAVRNRDVFMVEVTRDGQVIAMSQWSEGQEIRRDLRRERLLLSVPPSVSAQQLEYRGHTGSQMHVCTLVRERLVPTQEDLGGSVVQVLVDAPRADWPLALDRGLATDLGRCFDDERGVGMLIQPGAENHDIP